MVSCWYLDIAEGTYFSYWKGRSWWLWTSVCYSDINRAGEEVSAHLKAFSAAVWQWMSKNPKGDGDLDKHVSSHLVAVVWKGRTSYWANWQTTKLGENCSNLYLNVFHLSCFYWDLKWISCYFHYHYYFPITACSKVFFLPCIQRTLHCSFYLFTTTFNVLEYLPSPSRKKRNKKQFL